jgi:transposase InsO family protein
VTANPTAEWIARQITEAFPWDEAPRYLIRDRDTSYGTAVTRRLQAMGIRDRPIRPRSPWQNGHVERLIGSIRRECLDHVVVLGERHLRHSYLARRFPSALRSDGIIGRHRSSMERSKRNECRQAQADQDWNDNWRNDPGSNHARPPSGIAG